MSDRRKFELDLSVHAGPSERTNVAIDTILDIDNRLWYAGVEGRLDPFTLVLTDVASGGSLPVQWEEGLLSMIVPGSIPAGSERQLRLSFGVVPLGQPIVPPAKNNLTDRIVVKNLGRELLFHKNEHELCRYKHTDKWKPFFYPIYGPHGNVVRDRVYDSESHEHHHGLWLNYGTMDGNSTNIVTEVDRISPRRGPAGRMVHETFERFTYGWVYGLVRERLVYCRPDGEPFTHELRTLRVFAPTDGIQIIDWTSRVEEPEDPGGRGLGICARVNPSMRIVDATVRVLDAAATRDPLKPVLRPKPMEKPGKIAFGATNPWVDYSGPVGEGWDGIALFDHPSNPGYPSKGHASEYGLMSIGGGGYPQDDLHRGGAVTLRCRAYVHGGDAEAGRVEAAWHDYAHPCLVIPGEIRQADA